MPNLRHLWYFCLIMAVITSYLPHPWWAYVWLVLAITVAVVDIHTTDRKKDS